MAVVINSNPAAALASANLLKSNDLLQKSLARLSSGSRISVASDDAGGLAVSMKLTARIDRTASASVNLSNALSFLQTQSGSLKSAASALERMSELAVLSTDVSKSSQDIANYSTEFNNLYLELGKISADTFNDIRLFASPKGSLKVFLDEDGAQSMTIDQGPLMASYAAVSSLAAVTGSNLALFTEATQSIATMMAVNGAQASLIQFAIDALNGTRVGLEAANSRIQDLDVAAESSKLARANILVQSGGSMLSQANTVSQIALKLLQ
jgi:flagellin